MPVIQSSSLNHCLNVLKELISDDIESIIPYLQNLQLSRDVKYYEFVLRNVASFDKNAVSNGTFMNKFMDMTKIQASEMSNIFDNANSLSDAHKSNFMHSIKTDFILLCWYSIKDLFENIPVVPVSSNNKLGINQTTGLFEYTTKASYTATANGILDDIIHGSSGGSRIIAALSSSSDNSISVLPYEHLSQVEEVTSSATNNFYNGSERDLSPTTIYTEKINNGYTISITGATHMRDYARGYLNNNTSSNMTVKIEGLKPETDYKFRVFSYNNDASDYSQNNTLTVNGSIMTTTFQATDTDNAEYINTAVSNADGFIELVFSDNKHHIHLSYISVIEIADINEVTSSEHINFYKGLNTTLSESETYTEKINNGYTVKITGVSSLQSYARGYAASSQRVTIVVEGLTPGVEYKYKIFSYNSYPHHLHTQNNHTLTVNGEEKTTTYRNLGGSNEPSYTDITVADSYGKITLDFTPINHVLHISYVSVTPIAVMRPLTVFDLETISGISNLNKLGISSLNVFQNMHDMITELLDNNSEFMYRNAQLVTKLDNIRTFMKGMMYFIVHLTHVNKDVEDVLALHLYSSYADDKSTIYQDMLTNVNTNLIDIKYKNNKMIESKQKLDDATRDIERKQSLRDLQTYELYIMITLLVVIMIVVLIMNTKSYMHRHIKFTIVPCLILLFITIYVDWFYLDSTNIEMFYDDGEYYTPIERYINSVTRGFTNYMDYCSIDNNERDIIMHNVNSSLYREKYKITQITNSLTVESRKRRQEYKESSRDAQYYKFIIYLVIYFVILSILLNVYFLEYSEMFEPYSIVILYIILLTIGVSMFVYYYFKRTRYNASMFYFSPEKV